MGKIYNRFQGNKKRKKLRNNPTKSEIILWNELQGKKLDGYKFRRQYGVGPFVVDFYCPKLKLAIEIDGESHFKKELQEYDKKRQKYMEKFGIRFLRIFDIEIFENLDGALDAISNKIKQIEP